MPDTDIPLSENYTPPQAAGPTVVFDARKDRGKSLRARFFSFHGRIDRLTFFLRLLAVFGCLVGVYVLDIFLLRGYYWFGTGGFIIVLVVNALVLAWTVLSFISTLSLATRRLHDFDFSGKWICPLIALVIVSFVIGFGFMLFWLLNLAIMLVLLAVPGTKGKNRFGFNSVKAMLAEFD